MPTGMNALAPRSAIVFAMALLLLGGGCARLPSTGVTTLKPASVRELRSYLLEHKADVDLFRLRGPFAVTRFKDLEIRVPGTEPVVADLYLSAPADKAPLVILLHGYANSKDDHAYQAMHVASWGMHSLALQLPNQGPWIDNGKTLALLVDLISRQPELIDRRIDAGRIVLAGHSFGGAAVAVAMADGARAAGAVLLDPAGNDTELPGFLNQINKPVMLLGADEQRSAAVNRDYFYRYIRAGIAEISIRDAVHEDAQYPAELPLWWFTGESQATEALQITFVSALTAAAFSISSTGKFDYAWTSFGDAIKNGRIFNAKKK